MPGCFVSSCWGALMVNLCLCCHRPLTSHLHNTERRIDTSGLRRPWEGAWEGREVVAVAVVENMGTFLCVTECRRTHRVTCAFLSTGLQKPRSRPPRTTPLLQADVLAPLCNMGRTFSPILYLVCLSLPFCAESGGGCTRDVHALAVVPPTTRSRGDGELLL